MLQAETGYESPDPQSTTRGLHETTRGRCLASALIHSKRTNHQGMVWMESASLKGLQHMDILPLHRTFSLR